MDETEKRHRTEDIANAASLVVDAAESVEADTMAVHTPYGKAVVHADEHGADVELPGGATVHVRRE